MRRSASFQRLIVIGLSGPIVALNVWVLSQAFSYFDHLFTVLTVSAILSFLLNYPVKFFERVGISRAQAVIIVLLIGITLLVLLGLTLVPLIFDQLRGLLLGIPAWLEMSQDNLAWLDKWARARRLPLDLTGFSNRITVRVENQVQTFAGEAFGFALGTLSGLVDTVLVVVLAFYMLLYGDRLWRGLIDLLPSWLGPALSTSLRLNFHNFFITQLMLGLFMFVTLTPIFLVLKLPFALLFGLLIGVAELIPFIGATLGIGTVTILVLFQNWWLAIQVAILAVVVQQFKDNILAPRLMGNFTGLNPIWIFIALLMGAEIAGLLGALVAVPIAGTIKGTIDAVRAQKVDRVMPMAVDESP
ncbi:AI-2E family transporter [Aliterella atlantica]|uniref:Permease n=1 Tax=Aliterella atlantica CENA595 TaxID=1618023 RepID=A0A0D8ZXB6_9CYAN|nr:AI-2E family transporter [Aliterella atlantica]KJH71851.1 permease [Aliterella atlantica CENA595]